MPREAAVLGLQVIKGDRDSLTSAQRELVSIFVDYLRRLPEYGEKSWNSNPYDILNRLLTSHFQKEYPAWDRKSVDTLPDGGDKFMALMAGAAIPESPRRKRQKDLLSMGRFKRTIIENSNFYDDWRTRLGLEPERLVAGEPTKVEQIAARTYVENHAEGQ